MELVRNNNFPVVLDWECYQHWNENSTVRYEFRARSDDYQLMESIEECILEAKNSNIVSYISLYVETPSTILLPPLDYAWIQSMAYDISLSSFIPEYHNTYSRKWYRHKIKHMDLMLSTIKSQLILECLPNECTKYDVLIATKFDKENSLIRFYTANPELRMNRMLLIFLQPDIRKVQLNSGKEHYFLKKTNKVQKKKRRQPIRFKYTNSFVGPYVVNVKFRYNTHTTHLADVLEQYWPKND